MKKIVHIIEYEQRGTLWKLLSPLLQYPNHSILETKNEFCDISKGNTKNIEFVIHTSGRTFPMLLQTEYFLRKGLKISWYIHVLPDYIIEKGYLNFLRQCSYFQNKYGLNVITNSYASAQVFAEYNIHCNVVIMGIVKPKPVLPKRDLRYLENKIITVNTNEAEKYLMAKGIDRFCELMTVMNLIGDSAILGIDDFSKDGILRKKLTHEEFIWVLSKAKAYVQLSRSESYNITAIEAKQLKIPILVSNVGGHRDNIVFETQRCDSLADGANKLKRLLEGGVEVKEETKRNYQSSRRLENLQAFRLRLEKTCWGEEQ